MKARIFLTVLGLATRCWIVRAESLPITLATTLRLAGAQNLSLALARERIHEARSLLQQDRQTLFPWVAVASRSLTTARRLLKLTQSRREFGVGAVLEAVEAQRELTRAQTEHLRAIGDHHWRQWELGKAVGDEEPMETSARPQ